MAQWTIGKKIGAGFCLVLLQACAVGAYALWMTTQTSRQLQPVSTEYLPETELTAQIEREFLNARINFIYFVTVQKEGSLDKGWQRFGNAEQQLPKLQELVNRSEAFAPLRPEVEQLLHDFSSYKPVLLRIVDVVKSHRNKGPEFAALLTEWARLGSAMVDSAGRLSRKGTEAAMASAQQASSAAVQTTMVLAVSGLAGLVLGFTVMIFVTRNIARALREVTQELGSAAEQVESGATQIAESSQSLARGASDQAASLEETSASGEEINSMASRNAGNSKSAAGKMVEASEQVGQANVTLEHMVESMNEINASSGKISKIIKVIDEIAFQTNILALNAAVEAARAGAAGMGFAVVADEVRNLAQRSAQAARDTAELIEESISKSDDGKKRLTHVTIAVHSITESANQAKVLVEEVRLGSDEQAKGIAQVAHAIAQMEKITQTTAASAEESASAAEELSMQSGTLRTLVERLNGMVGGSDHRTLTHGGSEPRV